MELGTFGGSPAGKILYKLIVEINNTKLRRIIHNYISRFEKKMNAIQDIKDLGIRIHIAAILYKEVEDLVKNKKIAYAIETHLLNVLSKIKKNTCET